MENKALYQSEVHGGDANLNVLLDAIGSSLILTHDRFPSLLLLDHALMLSLQFRHELEVRNLVEDRSKAVSNLTLLL